MKLSDAFCQTIYYAIVRAGGSPTVATTAINYLLNLPPKPTAPDNEQEDAG